MGTVCMHACSVAKSCPTLCNPMDCNRKIPPSTGFPRQEYWSGLPFPSPEDLNPGTEPKSPTLAEVFFTNEPPGKPMRVPDQFVISADISGVEYVLAHLHFIIISSQ